MCSINYGRKSLRSLERRHTERNAVLQASPLFAKPFVQAQIKKNHKALRHFVRGLHRRPVDYPYGFPLQNASNAQNVSIWWHTCFVFSPWGLKRFQDMFVIQVNSAICLMELMFVTSVTNIPKCLTLSTLGTPLVVFMSVMSCFSLRPVS